MLEMPVVDPTRCDGCGLCIRVCRCQALVMVDNIIMVTEVENCGWCTECEAVCPNDAIRCPFEIVVAES